MELYIVDDNADQPPLAFCPEINKIPIVMMTSDISPPQIQQCYQAGANAVIVKPLNFSVLRDTFQSICKFWLANPQETKIHAK